MKNLRTQSLQDIGAGEILTIPDVQQGDIDTHLVSFYEICCLSSKISISLLLVIFVYKYLCTISTVSLIFLEYLFFMKWSIFHALFLYEFYSAYMYPTHLSLTLLSTVYNAHAYTEHSRHVLHSMYAYSTLHTYAQGRAIWCRPCLLDAQSENTMQPTRFSAVCSAELTVMANYPL
jgi:hypothetical protein